MPKGPKSMLLVACMTVFANAPTPAQAAGWVLEVHATAQAASIDEIRAAVHRALPSQFLERESNFSTDENYDPAKTYRIVLVFHPDGDDDVATCAGMPVTLPSGGQADLMMAQRLTAMLCEDGRLLARGDQKTLGRLQTSDIAFRFLVTDVLQQIFIWGYDRLPR